MRHVEYAFARVLHVPVDSLLYQIGQRVAGQSVQQIHIVQILIGFIEGAHQLLASATVRLFVASIALDFVHHFVVCQPDEDILR